ncbi:MAG: TraB/VirB10 family protein, partial [Pseudomonadota bacterium]
PLDLHRKLKRWLLVGGAVTAVTLVIAFTTDDAPEGTSNRVSMAPDGVVLTGDARPASLEAIVARLMEVNNRLDTMERAQASAQERRVREMTDLARTLERRMTSADAEAAKVARIQFETLRGEMRRLGVETGDLDDAAATVGAKTAKVEGPATLTLPYGRDDAETVPTTAEASPARGDDRSDTRRSDDIVVSGTDEVPSPVLDDEALRRLFRDELHRARPDHRPVVAQAMVSNQGTGQAPSPASTIRFLSGTAAPDRATDRRAIGGDEVFLPAGSILSGVLLNGLDAPGGSAASGNPMPVLVRLKHEAILPNRFGAEVRECFVLLSSFGDLSSERAQFRGEQFSCILRDGTVMQRDLAAYGVGEDGKVGMRGRVVTRQGAFLANAIIVGVLEGVASAFDDNAFISVGAGVGSSDGGGVTTALSGGFGGAFERIADWYLDQADTLFPVVEIDAGRSIDVILTQGMTFRVDLGGTP